MSQRHHAPLPDSDSDAECPGCGSLADDRLAFDRAATQGLQHCIHCGSLKCCMCDVGGGVACIRCDDRD